MKGSYILILKVEKDIVAEIGKLGILPFKKGYYAYVGSALNGLEQRITRHLRKKKKFHWHIDYFFDKTRIKEIWYEEGGEECETANVLSSFHSIKNFGCSDCTCKSHLFYSPSYKKLAHVIEKMGMRRYDVQKGV